jgi:hypothetical protein
VTADVSLFQKGVTNFEPRLAQSRRDKAMQGIEIVCRGHGSMDVAIFRHRVFLDANQTRKHDPRFRMHSRLPATSLFSR